MKRNNNWSFNGYVNKADVFTDPNNSKWFAALIDTDGNDFVKPALVLGETKEQVIERAKLIASAPKLLEVLQEAKKELRLLNVNSEGGQKQNTPASLVIHKIEEAINQATQ